MTQAQAWVQRRQPGTRAHGRADGARRKNTHEADATDTAHNAHDTRRDTRNAHDAHRTRHTDDTHPRRTIAHNSAHELTALGGLGQLQELWRGGAGVSGEPAALGGGRPSHQGDVCANDLRG